MHATLTATLFDRARLERAADLLAVLVVVSMPWSTTATSILLALWVIALAPTLGWPAVRRELLTAAGGLPVLFFLLGAVGMLWAEVPWNERLGGLNSFHRILFIPLLLAQFRRSGNGRWIMLGFLASCSVLLVASYAHFAWRHWVPDPAHWTFYGVPVKDYILQSAEFQVCAFGLAYAAMEAWRAQRPRLAFALGLFACAFLANIVYIVTGRSAVAVMPVLLALFGLRLFGWRGVLGVVLAGVLIATVAWFSSSYLRMRVSGVWNEAYRYETQNAETSAGERLEFWKKSLRFIAAAPVIGHGTGSIKQQFSTVVGTSGPSTIVSDNPHQQTLTVAIQLGLIGVAVMYAMWIAHLALFFRGAGLIAWCGLTVVAQNIVSSLFNSHLFDFNQGWFYVFGVGVLGGTLLSLRREPPRADDRMLADLSRRLKHTAAYGRYKHSLAYVTLREWDKALQRKFQLGKYRGTEFRCPVCGVDLRAFKPGAASYERMLREHGYIYPLGAIETFNVAAYSCPSCDASDRERLYALYLDGVLAAENPARRYRLLEFAPSFGLSRKLKRHPLVDYRSADLCRNNVDDRVDISDMRNYADASFDIVLCSHVLEHVPDDRRAMVELHRILRPDGFAIVMVPLVHGVDETNEDPAIATPALRWKYFGSDDHVRQYGKRDFADRLTAAGFAVERLGIDFFGAEAFRRAGIAADSVLYVVRKTAAPAA